MNVLVSGQLNGQCCAWDVRAGCEPVSCTPREICHRESANRVLWINSKTGTEFFSGGADGQVIWWDMRKLNERLDFLYMDPEKSDEPLLERSYGVSVLEYETTIPTRFMVGSEQGMLFFCNRKGKTPLEKITLRVRRLDTLCAFILILTFSLDHFINIFLPTMERDDEDDD